MEGEVLVDRDLGAEIRPGPDSMNDNSQPSS
jgi:hypothetical protein